VDPLIGIAITIAIIFIGRGAARTIWNHLIDGIEPAIVGEIEHAATHVAGVKGVHQVRARWVGHKVFAELEIEVQPDLQVSRAHEIADAVVQELRGHVRALGSAAVRIVPSTTG
jgi:divalent metal cation (Fe/Co/Zn/Cd) transporter